MFNYQLIKRISTNSDNRVIGILNRRLKNQVMIGYRDGTFEVWNTQDDTDFKMTEKIETSDNNIESFDAYMNTNGQISLIAFGGGSIKIYKKIDQKYEKEIFIKDGLKEMVTFPCGWYEGFFIIALTTDNKLKCWVYDDKNKIFLQINEEKAENIETIHQWGYFGKEEFISIEKIKDHNTPYIIKIWKYSKDDKIFKNIHSMSSVENMRYLGQDLFINNDNVIKSLDNDGFKQYITSTKNSKVTIMNPGFTKYRQLFVGYEDGQMQDLKASCHMFDAEALNQKDKVIGICNWENLLVIATPSSVEMWKCELEVYNGEALDKPTIINTHYKEKQEIIMVVPIGYNDTKLALTTKWINRGERVKFVDLTGSEKTHLGGMGIKFKIC